MGLSSGLSNKSNITIVSEANVEHNYLDKTIQRNSAFKDYKIEYKITNDYQKARVAVVLQNDVKYTRLHNLESKNCIRAGTFPEFLKIARLTPIYKPGKIKTDPNSYRPISNLNAIEKLVESLLKETRHNSETTVQLIENQ